MPAAVLVGVLAFLNYGCGQKKYTPAAYSGPLPNATAVVSAEKTSFTEVTSQLDPGGDFYLYLGTAQWLDGLSAKVASWRQVVNSIPDLKPDDAANVKKAFDIVTRLIKDSGIEDVSGVGMSSIAVEKGMFRNKMLLHHYPGKGDGFLWKLAGKEPHPLTGLDFLPDRNGDGCFLGHGLAAALDRREKGGRAGGSCRRRRNCWTKSPPNLNRQPRSNGTRSSIRSAANSAWSSRSIHPTNFQCRRRATHLEIPRPGLLIAVKVNDETIFDRIDQQLKANRQVISVNKSGLKMRTMPVPIPLIGELRPSAASSGGYLFIATTDGMINKALAVKSGQIAGLKTTDEFKHLSQGIPDQGNQFVFVSQRFAETMMQVQQQAITAQTGTQPAMVEMDAIHLTKAGPRFTYSVGVNTPEGCLTVGNSSQS